MKAYHLKAILVLFLFLLFMGMTIPADRARASYVPVLEQLDLGLAQGETLKTWYETQSNNHGSDTGFGAYVTLAVGNRLYLGLGSNLPAQDSGDGSYFAAYDGNTLTAIAEPDEQGLHEMIFDGWHIHIAGTDPHPDDHRAGNHYLYTPGGSFIKYRDPQNGLVNVYHTWGLWKSGSTLYAATGAHDGSDPVNCTYGVTCMGQVYASTNNGASWTKKSDLGGYRVYDIIGFNNSLYAIANDAQSAPLSLYKSVDGGTTWAALDGLQENLFRVHLVLFNNQLLAVGSARDVLYAISPQGQVIAYPLPQGYRAGTTYADSSYTDYHILALANGVLYLIAEKPSSEVAILQTDDLVEWTEVVVSPQRLISLSYWQEKNWLVTATPGTDAALWRVGLWDVPTVISTPAVRAFTPSAGWMPLGVFFSALLFFNGVILFRRRAP